MMSVQAKLTPKDMLKIAILLLCMIGALFSLLVSIFGFILWIINGFNFLYLFGSLFFFFVVTLPFSYIVKRYKPIWEKFELRIGYVPSPPKEQLRTFIQYVGILFAFFLLYNYFSGFITTIPEKVGVELAKDILRNIVQVNGILIGLSGIMYVQLLRMGGSRAKILNAVFLVITMFVASMLSSISVMVSTYNKTEILWLDIKNYPLNFLLFGIVSFLISLWIITPSKKSDEQSSSK